MYTHIYHMLCHTGNALKEESYVRPTHPQSAYENALDLNVAPDELPNYSENCLYHQTNLAKTDANEAIAESAIVTTQPHLCHQVSRCSAVAVMAVPCKRRCF